MMTWRELLDKASGKVLFALLVGWVLGCAITSLIGYFGRDQTPRVDPDVCQVFAIAAADQSSEDYPFVLIKGTEVGCFHVGEGE